MADGDELATLNPADIVEEDGTAFGDPVEHEADKVEAEAEPEPENVVKMTAKEILEKRGDFSRTAYVVNQADRYPHTLIPDGLQVVVLDLSDESDLKRLNELKQQDFDPDFGLTIYKENLVYSENTDNWKVYLEIAHFKFTTPLKANE